MTARRFDAVLRWGLLGYADLRFAATDGRYLLWLK
jgi:hypothetical protein